MCGCFVRIANFVFTLLFICSTTIASADPVIEIKLRDIETSLLHRRLDLSGVKQLQRTTAAWHSLALSHKKIFVINLWSVHCQPCIEEFPLFRKMVEGWRSQSDVQFLFIADPPRETEEEELIKFWRNLPTQLPDQDPCRSTDERLRNILEAGTEPITLLVDEHMIIRQAFAGTITKRNLATAIQRLLNALQSEQQRAPSRQASHHERGT